MGLKIQTNLHGYHDIQEPKIVKDRMIRLGQQILALQCCWKIRKSEGEGTIIGPSKYFISTAKSAGWWPVGQVGNYLCLFLTEQA